MDLADAPDTIAAIATPAGRGGIGIVRLSGPEALHISQTICDREPRPREATLVSFRDKEGEVLDRGLVLHFPAPYSFTGEDVAELHCHGGPAVLSAILHACLQYGARGAQAGEFSQRAFLNGKIDLVQAEAIADLIAASSRAAARSASRSLSGEFSKRVNRILDGLTKLRVFVEAAIDFPEEEIDFIAESDVGERIAGLHGELNELLITARRGRRLRDGLKIVLAGAPNAGKSSLLNQLAEAESAIVTDIPGTTRDVLREHIDIDGMPLHVVDTAGLRDTEDAVEREGVRRAEAEIRSADCIVLVSDSSIGDRHASDEDICAVHAERLGEAVPIIIVRNKIDAVGESPGIASSEASRVESRINLSAKTGAGIDLLRRQLLESAGLGEGTDSDFIARERHIVSLENTLAHLEASQSALCDRRAPELLAEDLRYAQDALGQITGKLSSDDLLGEIFSSFCIGK
ncbi:MAG: tRNA uridine-5-carboxymethylaminomethyl(34) synthesis GTPase MnmE [Pseudomonadota bacterium]